MGDPTTNGHAGNGNGHARTTCKRCGGSLPEGRRAYCGDACSSQRNRRDYRPAKGEPAPTPDLAACAPAPGDTIREERLKRHVVEAYLKAGGGEALPTALDVLVRFAQADGKDGRPRCHERTRRLAAESLAKLYAQVTSGKIDPLDEPVESPMRGLSLAEVGELLRAQRDAQWGAGSGTPRAAG